MLSATKSDPIKLVQSKLSTAQKELLRAESKVKTLINLLWRIPLLNERKTYFLRAIRPLLETGPAGSGYLAYMALKEEILLKISEYSYERSSLMSQLTELETHLHNLRTTGDTYANDNPASPLSRSSYIQKVEEFLIDYPKWLNRVNRLKDSIDLSMSMTEVLDRKITNAFKIHQEAQSMPERIKALEAKLAQITNENAGLKALLESLEYYTPSALTMFKPR